MNINIDKKKAIILTIIVAVIIITIGIIILINVNKGKSSSDSLKTTKTSQLYNKILEAKSMTFTKTLDDNNKIFIALKDNKAYKEITRNGNTQKYIVKDGDTYFLDEENKKYYRYRSNYAILTEVKEQFEGLYTNNFSEGKEKLEGKNYKFEEFPAYQEFLFNYDLSTNDLDLAKTKLYYSGGNLVYVKTIVDEKEELLKMDISFKGVSDNYFNIPDDLSEGEEY